MLVSESLVPLGLRETNGSDEHGHVEIPAAVHRVLLQVLEAMKAGKAVTVAPQTKLPTTQQAADLLGVSRPTVVKLIDEGVLPGDTTGKRRRTLKLDDLLAYRARRREAQYRALLETSVDYDEDPEDAEVAEERFRRVRAERDPQSSVTLGRGSRSLAGW